MINTSRQKLLSISNTLFEREVSDKDDVVDDNSCTCEPTKVYYNKLLGYALKTQKTKQKRKKTKYLVSIVQFEAKVWPQMQTAEPKKQPQKTEQKSELLTVPKVLKTRSRALSLLSFSGGQSGKVRSSTTQIHFMSWHISRQTNSIVQSPEAASWFFSPCKEQTTVFIKHLKYFNKCLMIASRVMAVSLCSVMPLTSAYTVSTSAWTLFLIVFVLPQYWGHCLKIVLVEGKHGMGEDQYPSC